MKTRLRTGSLTRPREASMDSDGGGSRHQLIDELDMEYDGVESGKTLAHLIALQKEEEVGPPAPLPPKGMSTRRKSASKAIPVPQMSGGVAQSSQQASLAGSYESSGSGFISGIMENTNNQGGQGTTGSTFVLTHTPPTAAGTSYEGQHFGKRPRSGSVSGRLRSASFLEDKGVIDRNQKAILKDLIISGDEALQDALDKYEKGDTQPLEQMIRSGELASRHAADIDLLGDLDLDFLNVDDHFGDIGVASLDHQPSSMPLQAPPSLPSKGFAMSATNAVGPSPSVVTHDDDAIGGLDIHGDFTSDDYMQLSAAQKQASGAAAADTRFRSNSLAYGPLLNDQGIVADNSAQYGNWMDRDLVQTRDGRVDSISGVSFASSADPPTIGGIAESLAQYAKTKGDAKPPTKAQVAEQKRRERQEKKEQKEREKAEKKEQRERAKGEKKEREAFEKQERKEKKAAALKVKKLKEKQEEKIVKVEDTEPEEPKETPSGLGRPRSMSDPNLTTSIDEFGLLSVDRPEGWVGAYSPESRKMRIDRFMAKRDHRVWTKKVKYDVRKNFADSRLRVKGRFVKKEDELLMRDLMSLT